MNRKARVSSNKKLVGWRSSLQVEAIATRVEAIAIRCY